VSLSGGLLTICCQAKQGIEKATITLDKKDRALEEAGVIPSEIFVDQASLAASGDQQRTIQIPLPATPALAGIREVAVVCGSGAKRGPLDVSFTAFRFAPLRQPQKRR
jgi:hypothetical protein